MRVKCELDQYVLKKRQGVGGMSLVFAAKDVNLGRNVAIKILNETYSMDAKRIQQFEQEAMITAGISHPHVVRVYTVGQAFNRYYIAMELVTGQSLESVMAERGAIPEDELLPIVVQVTEGLQAAYQAGLIHRDIKPGNILLDGLGMAKIVDFGLALVTHGGSAIADEIWATPYYVPPEALDGQPEDFRSDIYALCATLYHAIAGKPPFTTQTRHTTELRDIKKTIPPLKEVAPWLSDSTCAVVDRGMQFAPDDRFTSYDEMLEALHYAQAVIESDGALPPVHSAERMKRRVAAKSWHKIAIPAAAGAIVLGVGGVLLLKALNKPEDPGPIIQNPSGGDDDGAGTTVQLSDAVNREYSDALRMMKQGNYGGAAQKLKAIMRNPEVPEPAASLAGMHAVIAHMVDGKPEIGRRAVDELSAHLKEVPDQSIEVISRMNNQVSSLKSAFRISLNSVKGPKDAFRTMMVFASGLKGWEQLHWKEATALLGAISNAKFKTQMVDREFFVHYQQIAKLYLNDLEVVGKWVRRRSRQFNSVDEGKRIIAELTKSQQQLRSKGRRCRWMLKNWKEDAQVKVSRLVAQVNKPPEKPPVKPPVKPAGGDWEEVFGKVKPLVAGMQLKKAAELLKLEKFTRPLDVQRKNQMIYMCESGAGFLESIDDELRGKRAAFEVQRKDGKSKYSQISGSSEKGLMVSNGGEAVLLEWKDISPDTLLMMHLKLTANGLSDFEKNIRLEQAIAYAWLAGEREKANNAAVRLSETNAIFKRRWSECMRVLGQ